jgi:predicted NAD/FAD-binding protein
MALCSTVVANFIAFLKDLKIPTVPTDMTFGVSRDFGAFEWAGTSLSAVFAQRENLFSLRIWAMILDVFRFNQFALDLLSREASFQKPRDGSKKEDVKTWKDESIGDYLKRGKYSDAFRDDYLIPMTAAIWSTRPDKCSLDFPALTLVRFM